ncbi:MAG: BREX system P-loop protein BrxC [Anaplasmataceae bacterium]|nr:BREX system P-loop protein BrxC [Anaplasmataceae bacterium]
MLNKEIFTLNPDDNNLLNDGVVEINTSKDENGLKIVRHELKTFVCEGEYQKGIYRILQTYLNNFDQPKQPAVWVSGFFGSGKSHLVKMLGYLWDDFQFPDGATARSIKPLPTDVNDLLTELSRKQAVHGKLSVSGTLKDFPSADIRYSFLQLFMNALNLPAQYHHFKFVHWCMKEGFYDELKALIEKEGKDFKAEYENLFVSNTLAKSILKLRPQFADSEAKVKENFKANFKRVDRISRNELIDTLRDEVFPLFFKKNIPCTIVVLDELQQFIGSDGDKAIELQNLAQDLSSSFDGKLFLVGTGQNALVETPYLQKLQDRFTVKVALSDTDVETVTRKTVLAKKASAIPAIQTKLDNTLGEISRNLAGTDFAFRTDDKETLVADYPVMPSTRKFWKKILQVIDTAGTSGQLRSQLRIIDDGVKKVAAKELGDFIPADFIFDQKKNQLLQNAMLLQETNNLMEDLRKKGGDNILLARIIGIVFLIDKLPSDHAGSKLKSDKNTIADLLIESLNADSDIFRKKVSDAIDALAEKKVLMPIGTEFKLQTRAGQEWETEFTAQVTKLINDGEDQVHRIRKERILHILKDKTKTILIQQGNSKQKREFDIYSGTEKPNTENKLNIWMRDEWLENEALVLDEIRAEGANSQLAYLFIKKLKAEDLKTEIIKFRAAELTLNAKGVPSSPEGEQAKRSMETRKGLAEHQVGDLIESILKDAVVYLAGGNKVDLGAIGENIKKSLDDIAIRQFSDFSKADFKDWDKALTKALQGDQTALQKIGYNGDVKDHPVAIAILNFIGNNTKKGKEIRDNFLKSPFGWSQDAVDAIIILLRLSENISTTEANLNQARIGAAEFKKETHTLTTAEKIEIRKLYQVAGISCKSTEEFKESNSFLSILRMLGDKVSGDAPLPEKENTQFIRDIENLDGNERLRKIFEDKNLLSDTFKEWNIKSETIKTRIPQWTALTELNRFVPANEKTADIKKEVTAIRENRLLLSEPDPVASPLNQIADFLKTELKSNQSNYAASHIGQLKTLEANTYWQKISKAQQQEILAQFDLLELPTVETASNEKILSSLEKISLPAWADKIGVLPAKFQSALEEAIKLTAPTAETFSVPRKTISNEKELDEYITDVKTQVTKLLKKGNSVIIK